MINDVVRGELGEKVKKGEEVIATCHDTFEDGMGVDGTCRAGGHHGCVGQRKNKLSCS